MNDFWEALKNDPTMELIQLLREDLERQAKNDQMLLFVICARDICEKFVYKHTETIENIKNYPTF